VQKPEPKSKTRGEYRASGLLQKKAVRTEEPEASIKIEFDDVPTLVEVQATHMSAKPPQSSENGSSLVSLAFTISCVIDSLKQKPLLHGKAAKRDKEVHLLMCSTDPSEQALKHRWCGFSLADKTTLESVQRSIWKNVPEKIKSGPTNPYFFKEFVETSDSSSRSSDHSSDSEGDDDQSSGPKCSTVVYEYSEFKNFVPLRVQELFAKYNIIIRNTPTTIKEWDRAALMLISNGDMKLKREIQSELTLISFIFC